MGMAPYRLVWGDVEWALFANYLDVVSQLNTQVLLTATTSIEGELRYSNLDHLSFALRDAVKLGHEQGCILCKKYPKSVAQFCGQQCLNSAYAKAPMLISIDRTDPKFDDSKSYINSLSIINYSCTVVNQFNLSWRHTDKAKPPVAHVYKIVLSKQLMDNYFLYQCVFRTCPK